MEKKAKEIIKALRDIDVLFVDGENPMRDNALLFVDDNLVEETIEEALKNNRYVAGSCLCDCHKFGYEKECIATGDCK